MDWVIVNYYPARVVGGRAPYSGETFTVIESEMQTYEKYHRIKKQIKFCLPLILGFVQLLK